MKNFCALLIFFNTYLFAQNSNTQVNDIVANSKSSSIVITPEICMIQVDSLSANNIIYWNKTLYPSADTFYIYRDTANYNYALIGKVPYDSLSLFNDTLRSLYAANGDPNLTSWKYKIAYHDSVTNTMSPMSPWHQSIYQYNVGGLFIWNHYQIEGQVTPVPGLTNYLLMRESIGGTGDWVVAATASSSSTSINDPQFSTYQNTANWRIETLWSTSCDPNLFIQQTPLEPRPKSMLTVNTTRSNIRHNAMSAGIKKENLDAPSIYPNPAVGQLNINSEKLIIQEIRIVSLLGKIVFNEPINSKTTTIDLTHFSKGIYSIVIICNDVIFDKKLVVN
jgi:hypothetical protein